VQFALALREYDVLKHQPHPPGYILYVVLGRIVNAWLDDPTASYVALAVAFSGLTTFVVYLLARTVYDRTTAIVAASLLAVSPLFWFYGSVGLTYAGEALGASTVAYFAFRALRGSRTDAWLAAAIAPASLPANTLRRLRSIWRPTRSMPSWQRPQVCTSGMACSRAAEIASPHSTQVPYAPSLIRSSAADRRFTRFISSSRVAKPTSRLSLAWIPSTSSAKGQLSRIVQGSSSIAAAPPRWRSRDTAVFRS